jgi:hypothetical protein
MKINRDGIEHDCCDRCEGEFSEDNPRSTKEFISGRGYGLDLCEDCDLSFESWIKCDIG